MPRYTEGGLNPRRVRDILAREGIKMGTIKTGWAKSNDAIEVRTLSQRMWRIQTMDDLEKVSTYLRQDDAAR